MEQLFNKVIESAPLKKYGLKFMGIGAENICFEVEGSSRKLIKVNLHTLRLKVLQLLNDPRLKDISISSLEQEENIVEYQEQEKNIKDVFGEEHVLNRGVFRKKIPLNKELILNILTKEERSLADKLNQDNEYEIEMLVHTQLIAQELKNKRLHHTEDFATDLITSTNFKSSKNIDEALEKIRGIVNSEFIIEKVNNFKYGSVIEEITKKIIKYVKKTGLMLDIFGPNNITMFTEMDGKVNFHLTDVILPGPLKNWNKNIKDDKNFELLRHTYTFYYSLSNLAERIGIEEKLELQDLIYFKEATIPTGHWPSKNLNSTSATP